MDLWVAGVVGEEDFGELGVVLPEESGVLRGVSVVCTGVYAGAYRE